MLMTLKHSIEIYAFYLYQQKYDYRPQVGSAGQGACHQAYDLILIPRTPMEEVENDP